MCRAVGFRGARLQRARTAYHGTLQTCPTVAAYTVIESQEYLLVDNPSLDARLSKISTIWTVLRQAHGGPADAAAAAQQVLLQRYGGAIHRYLLAILRDRHAADDLTQEFGLR